MARSPAEIQADIAVTRRVIEHQLDAIQRKVPRRWAPQAAYSDYTQLIGLVAGSDLQPNSILQEGMLVTPPSIREGQREVGVKTVARYLPGGVLDL